jgi:hypothetical protein
MECIPRVECNLTVIPTYLLLYGRDAKGRDGHSAPAYQGADENVWNYE